MPRVLTVRPAVRWRRVPLAVVEVAAQLVVGVLVLVLRIVRVIVTVAADTAVRAEAQLEARTGRPALSHTGIAALAAGFVNEFRTAYRAPAR